MSEEILEFEPTAEAQENNSAATNEDNAANDPALAGDNADADNNAAENENGADGAVDNSGNGTDGSVEDTTEYIEITVSGGVRSLNRDEATHYAQRGVELEATYQKLDYLATAQGITVDEFLKSQLDARENAYRQELESRVPNKEDVEKLMGLYRSQEKEKYEQAILGRKKAEETARQTRESKIADDFLKLQKEFPEVKDYKSLPKEVKSAVAKGQDLMSAYLLHQHREGQAVKKAEESAKAAAAASAGSMQSEVRNNEEAYSEFRRSLFAD